MTDNRPHTEILTVPGLPDRGCRFDINDDRVVDIDQIVGGISKEGLPAMGSGPSRRRIGR